MFALIIVESIEEMLNNWEMIVMKEDDDKRS